jgi:starch phosphorylase
MAATDWGTGRFELRRKASFTALTQGAQRPVATQKDVAGVWDLISSYSGSSKEELKVSIARHLEYTLACTRFSFTADDAYRAASYTTRDRLIEGLNDTSMHFKNQNVKRAYYLSLEFLMGRYFQNALVNLDLEPGFKEAVEDLGYKLEDLYDHEHDPALGNGGLGRLAACFLDSMATTNLPVWGYGIRYTYGIFEQKIVNGRQVEHPDYWLTNHNPWEIARPDVTYAVRFYGECEVFTDPNNKKRTRWVGGEIVEAVAHDSPIPGFDTLNVIGLRLWKAAPPKEFDFNKFNAGDYISAVDERQKAEAISSVLYPNDNTDAGKELRLKQQYFFVCASLQDILRSFVKEKPGRSWSELPDKVAIQLNDTHPAISIPELMRILVDDQEVHWDDAWGIVKKVFNYTNHTVLPEALEKWKVALMRKLLPRHVEIIGEINRRFLDEVTKKWGQSERAWALSIFAGFGDDEVIRMGHLSVIGSNKVNGVAAIHTEIVKKTIFKGFFDWFNDNGQKDKFVNMTNGVTPRRWIHCANRPLSDLLSQTLMSENWLSKLDLLQGLEHHLNNKTLQEKWMAVKLRAKERLASWLEDHCGVKVNPKSLFDIQVKRIHEYKRQQMFCMFMIHRYLAIKDTKATDRPSKFPVPRVCLVGGKAAPGYYDAKTLIKLVNCIAQVVNNDKEVNQYLQVLFMPNYNVTSAQTIIPASDVSEHISTAGTEASGTSNMKFVMNGGRIVGTNDGANVEIREEAGDDTMFVFGCAEHQVEDIRRAAREGHYPVCHELRRCYDAIFAGTFSCNEEDTHSEFTRYFGKLNSNGYGHNGDTYLVAHDFPSYLEAQAKVDREYVNKPKWAELSIKAASKTGKFSTDRTMMEYAKTIWNIEPCACPAPGQQKTPAAPQVAAAKSGKKR